jgi:hypothetical protein
MRCLSCHYDLKNLPENRCPECGRAFDPNDPTTFRSTRILQVLKDTYVLSFFVTWIVLFLLVWRSPFPWYYDLFKAAIGAALIAVVVAFFLVMLYSLIRKCRRF